MIIVLICTSYNFLMSKSTNIMLMPNHLTVMYFAYAIIVLCLNRNTVKEIIKQQPHPILGGDHPAIRVQIFHPRPGKKRDRMNENIEIEPSEIVDDVEVS